MDRRLHIAWGIVFVMIGDAVCECEAVQLETLKTQSITGRHKLHPSGDTKNGMNTNQKYLSGAENLS